MAVLSTTLGSPSLCIRGGVQYEQQTLSPHSGLYNFYSPVNNNWSFVNSLRSQNSRVRGEYSLENKFEQGYFNFETWNGGTCYSTDGTKSGYYSLPFSGNTPPLANFWGRGENSLIRDSLYNYGYEGIYPDIKSVQKNIGVACVMSGVDVGHSGIYPDLKLFTGFIPTGEITIYGRVGSVNPSYISTDKILSFNVSHSGGMGEPTLESTGTSYPTSGTNSIGTGNKSWLTPENVVSNDLNSAQCTLEDNLTDSSLYLVASNFGFSIPSDATITGIEVVVARKNGTVFSLNNIVDSEIKLQSGGTIFPHNKAVVGSWPIFTGPFTHTYGDSTDLWGRSWTASEINDSTFGVAVAVACTNDSNPAKAEVDYVTASVSYSVTTTTPELPLAGSFALSNFDQGVSRRLVWSLRGFTDKRDIELSSHRVTSNSFSNFLMTYSKATGIGRFYTSSDDTPLILENVVNLGDISKAFNGKVSFCEDSYAASSTVPKTNNPKLITDFGISNRAWTDLDIFEFDQHRLNGAYFIAENPTTASPAPSGADTTSIAFHFPPRASGLIGSSHSGVFNATNYYIPLSSGICDRLYQFDRSQFNQTALSLDMWVSNTGTNPSGNLGARIDFCCKTDYFGRDLFTPLHVWSGYPISIPSGIKQVRMSGLFVDYDGNPSDLVDVTPREARQAGLFVGAWYNDIGREYSGDIKVYSAKVNLDGFVNPPVKSGSLPLYCAGKPIVNNSVDLYLHSQVVYSSLDLFVGGHEAASGQLNFYIAGSTAYGSIPLYTKGSSTPGQANDNLSLYTQGPLFGESNASMNLFLKNDNPSSNGSLDLFCANYFAGASGELKLFLQGASSIPINASMNLFLNRDTESIAHNIPLFISGPNTIDAEIPLYIKGADTQTGELPLHIDGIGHVKNTVKLYTHGF